MNNDDAQYTATSSNEDLQILKLKTPTEILREMYSVSYTKVKEVQDPVRGTPGSAGIDLFVPEDIEPITLQPLERCTLPSGIKFRVPKGHALIAKNKSGVAVKKGLLVGAQVIDSDYTGETHINMFNCSNEEVTISPGDKIVQLLLTPINHCELFEVEDEETLFENFETERGEGRFGSTNK